MAHIKQAFPTLPGLNCLIRRRTHRKTRQQISAQSGWAMLPVKEGSSCAEERPQPSNLTLVNQVTRSFRPLTLAACHASFHLPCVIIFLNSQHSQRMLHNLSYSYLPELSFHPLKLTTLSINKHRSQPAYLHFVFLSSSYRDIKNVNCR